jgi:hypothetical protein
MVCDPRKNKLDGNKTDKVDTKRLAELLRTNALKAVYCSISCSLPADNSISKNL